jgi:hypothetical protein
MSTRPKLPSGLRGFTNEHGKWVCTGAQMGRSNRIHCDQFSASPKLRMVRLRMSPCGCYDEGGAYWGIGLPLYWAEGVANAGEGTDDRRIYRVFVRAAQREQAKQAVRALIPHARFFN